MTGYTLQLDINNWDLTLDSVGKLAVTTGPYAVAQNVANAQRLFKKDACLFQKRGIPHFQTELGDKYSVSASVTRSRLKKTAKSVEGVKDATALLRLEEGRIIGVTTKITLNDGTTAEIEV